MVRFRLEKNPKASAARTSLILAIVTASVLASFSAIHHYALIPTIVGAVFIAAVSGGTNYWVSLRKISRLP